MASSNVSSVVNFFPTVNEGFTTTLNGTIVPGATTVPLNGTSGLTDGSVFVGIIEPGLTNQQVFTGTVSVSGVSITNVVWTRGTNVTHLGGVTIVDYVTGTALNMIRAGILKDHVQIGGHNVLHDVNNNIWIDQGATTSAVNRLKVANAASGNAPTLSTTGNDTNIDLVFTPKGTGALKGVVDHLYNPYKFSVYCSTSPALSASVALKVPLNTKNFDTGSNFDNVTNFRFTAPVAGFYFFTGQATVGGSGITSGAWGLTYLLKNGLEVARSQQVQGTGNANGILTLPVFSFLQLAANDYIELWAQTTDTGRVVAGGSNLTFLHSFLVSQQ